MSATLNPSSNPLHSFTLVQSFGVAAFFIVFGVMSTWVYLKRSSSQEIQAVPGLEIPTIAPIEAGFADDQSELDEVQTWVQFGEEAYAAGRVVSPVADNALYYYQKALSKAPVQVEALAGMDRVLSHLVSGSESAIFKGDWPSARNYSEKLQEIRPDDARSTGLLRRINRFEQLENLLARADRQMAAARLTEPGSDNALQTYRRILEIDPGNAKALDGVASIVQRLLGFAQSAALAGEQDKALRHINKVKSIDKQAAGLADAEQVVGQWSEMASSRHLQEQLEAASKALEEGRLTTPEKSSALALFNQVLDLDPNSGAARQGKRLVIRALADRAWSEIRAKRFRDAEATVIQAREAGAESYALTELEQELEFQEALAKARRGEFDRLYAVSDLDPKRRVVPEYPRKAKGNGWVELRFTVLENGKVVDAVVHESSSKTFDEAALKAIARWTFSSPTFKGRPIPVRSGARFSFKE